MSEGDIHTRGRREAEALGHLGQVQLVDVVHGSQAVAGVCVQVGFEGLLGALLEVVVLADELLQLRLNVDNLLDGELKLDDGHAGRLEVREEANLIGLEEQETPALGVGASGGTTDTVNVVAGIVRGVKLHNEVDSGDLNTISMVALVEGVRVELTSRPRAATSVQMRIPFSALLNSKKVLVRFCCFCLPCRSRTGQSM